MNDTTDQKIDELWLLALARQHNEQAKARKNELLKKVEESLEFKEIISYLKTSESVIFALTASIKAEYAALAMKDEKGRYIQIHDSIIFKDSNTVTVAYDPARALEYSLKSFMPAVALNIGIFEKAAKEGLLPKDLVTVEKKTVPQAQIASDLRNLLEESEIPF